jgi:hypothetical protein
MTHGDSHWNHAQQLAEARASAFDAAADIIADRYMPVCVCDTCGNHAEAAKVRRIIERLTDEADAIRDQHGLERP